MYVETMCMEIHVHSTLALRNQKEGEVTHPPRQTNRDTWMPSLENLAAYVWFLCMYTIIIHQACQHLQHVYTYTCTWHVITIHDIVLFPASLSALTANIHGFVSCFGDSGIRLIVIPDHV